MKIIESEPLFVAARTSEGREPTVADRLTGQLAGPLTRFVAQVREHYKRRTPGHGQKSLFDGPAIQTRQHKIQWDESQHPREEDGEFAPKGEGRAHAEMEGNRGVPEHLKPENLEATIEKARNAADDGNRADPDVPSAAYDPTVKDLEGLKETRRLAAHPSNKGSVAEALQKGAAAAEQRLASDDYLSKLVRRKAAITPDEAKAIRDAKTAEEDAGRKDRQRDVAELRQRQRNNKDMLPTAEEIEKAKADLAQQLSAQIHARQAKQIEAPAAKVPAGTASARLAENIAEASAAGATPYIQVERKLPNGKRRYEAWTPEGKLLMSSPRITANAQSLARRKGRYENVLNFMPELEEADDFQEQLGKQLSEADAREAELTAKRQRLESQSAARTGPGPRGESADSESANNDRSTIGAGPGPHGHYEEEDAKQADDPAVKTLLDERQRILDEAWQTVNATGYDDFPNKNRRHEAQEALKRIDADLAHRGRQPSIYPSLSEHLEARVMQRDLRRTAEQKRGTEYDPATGEFSAPRADAAAAATPPEGAASLSQITAAMAKRRKRPTAAEFKRLKAALQEERAKGEGQQDQGPQKRRQEASDEVLREAQHQLDLETVKPQGVPPGKAYDAQDEARGAAIKAKLIQDFGEKIGGARKDTARPIGARKDPGKPKDDRPGWARRYDVHQIAKSSNPFEEGKWAVYDSKQKNFLGQAKRVGVFESREEAEKAVPRAEAARAHGVSAVQRPDGGTEFYIYRKVNDRKHPVVKSGFASMEEARRYLAEHPREIVEHKFPSYEEYQYLDHVERQGGQSRQGDVSTKQFHSTFGFRGGEFGKWQENRDGQTSLNHAYDALHDLADVLGLPPKALALDNTLSIGFGSRGTGGKLAPRAHYEPDKRVINLTKMKGAGTLAHEWVHGMDDYFGRQQMETPETSQHASARLPAAKGLRPEIHEAWNHLLDTIAAKDVTAPVEKAAADAQLGRIRQHVAQRIEDLERGLQPDRSRKTKALTTEQKQEWDDAKARLLSGDPGPSQWVPGKPAANRGGRPSMTGHDSYEPLEKLNRLYKAATGRSFHTSDRDSNGHKLYWSVKAALDAEQRVKDAAAGKTNTSKQPTQFLREARRLDETRDSDYYTLRHEMVARAFEGYVYDKLKQSQRRNDYLVGKAENEYYRALGMAPFPEGEERTAINAAFDRLFQAVKHEPREDEKGQHVKMYARALAGQMVERYQRLAAGRRVERYGTDANGMNHKDKGDGGGQFAPKADSGGAARANHAGDAAAVPEERSFTRDKTRDAAHREFLEGPPVVSIRGDEVPFYGKGNVDKLVAWIGRWFRTEHNGKAVNPQLGEVQMDANCASESIAHGTNPVKSSAFIAVPAIIQQGRIMSQGKGGKTGGMDTYILGAPIEIAGEAYAGMVMVRKDENGQRFYVHEVRAIKMLQVRRSMHGAAAEAVERPAAKLGAIDSLLREIFGIKEEPGENQQQPEKEPYSRQSPVERLTRQMVQRYGRPAAGQAALFTNPAAPGKAWREELHPRDHGRFTDKNAARVQPDPGPAPKNLPAPGQRGLFGDEVQPAGAKRVEATPPPALPKQRQETLFHGLKDAPGQQDLFSADKGTAPAQAAGLAASMARQMRAFLAGQAIERYAKGKGHDVSGEARASDGTWTDGPQAAAKKPKKIDRTTWGKQHDRCWLCGGRGSATMPLQTHEIARGPARAAALKDPAAWLRVCAHCHGAKMPDVAGQLALKRRHDEEYYDRVAVNLLRGRQPGAITEADVDRAEKKLPAFDQFQGA